MIDRLPGAGNFAPVTKTVMRPVGWFGGILDRINETVVHPQALLSDSELMKLNAEQRLAEQGVADLSRFLKDEYADELKEDGVTLVSKDGAPLPYDMEELIVRARTISASGARELTAAEILVKDGKEGEKGFFVESEDLVEMSNPGHYVGHDATIFNIEPGANGQPFAQFTAGLTDEGISTRLAFFGRVGELVEYVPSAYRAGHVVMTHEARTEERPSLILG